MIKFQSISKFLCFLRRLLIKITVAKINSYKSLELLNKKIKKTPQNYIGFNEPWWQEFKMKIWGHNAWKKNLPTENMTKYERHGNMYGRGIKPPKQTLYL